MESNKKMYESLLRGMGISSAEDLINRISAVTGDDRNVSHTTSKALYTEQTGWTDLAITTAQQFLQSRAALIGLVLDVSPVWKTDLKRESVENAIRMYVEEMMKESGAQEREEIINFLLNNQNIVQLLASLQS